MKNLNIGKIYRISFTTQILKTTVKKYLVCQYGSDKFLILAKFNDRWAWMVIIWNLGKQKIPWTARNLSTRKTLLMFGGVFNRKLWIFIFSTMVYLACFGSIFWVLMAVINVNQILSFILYLKVWIFVRSAYFYCLCWEIVIIVWTQSLAFFSLLLIPSVFWIKLPFPACSFSWISSDIREKNKIK